MTRVAIFCAAPVQSNPGMLSVDAAFLSLVRKHGLTIEPRFFRMEDLAVGDSTHPIRYMNAIANQEALWECSKIIYWGDFLHCMSYHRIDLQRRIAYFGLAKDDIEATSLVYKLLFLEERPTEELGRVAVFGGNMFSQWPAAFANQRYASNVAKLFGAAALIRMRDPLSAAIAARFRSPG